MGFMKHLGMLLETKLWDGLLMERPLRDVRKIVDIHRPNCGVFMNKTDLFACDY